MKKKSLITILVSIGISGYAQEVEDVSKLPATVPYTKSIAGNSKMATTHGEFAYDTISIVLLNRYGVNEDPIGSGKYDDKYDTLYFQRKVSFDYAPKEIITYKLFKVK